MDITENKSKTKNKDTPPRQHDLSILETCCSGLIMGFIAYSGSFSAVPILFTFTALIFGPKSSITVVVTAFAQLLAGYLHTHSSRTGMYVSTKIFHGFYIATSDVKNRRLNNEPRWQSWRRFFWVHPLNAFVLNIMWQTFTIYYILQTEFMIRVTESLTSNRIESQNRNEATSSLTAKNLEHRLILYHGFTRYIAGCLSGTSTGIINHLWQRYRARSKNSYAIFNTNKKKLNLEWKERKKLLSPCNMENWIKVFSMVICASFVILSNMPNITGLHLLDSRKKKLITDILVINGGWFYFRDSAMLIFKKDEKAPATPSDTTQTPLMDEEIKTKEENQSETFRNIAEV